jgi:hypothetical protein
MIAGDLLLARPHRAFSIALKKVKKMLAHINCARLPTEGGIDLL